MKYISNVIEINVCCEDKSNFNTLLEKEGESAKLAIFVCFDRFFKS